VLHDGLRSVVVRRAHPLRPDELLEILRSSAVAYTELVEWLDAPKYESSVRRRTLPEVDAAVETKDRKKDR
jgi:hypothetical protein